MKRVMVSASTNPPKEDDLIDYVKKIDGLIDFMHCEVNACLVKKLKR